MRLARLLLLAALASTTGCMTTTALVTGPITSMVSIARAQQNVGEACLVVPTIGIILLPFGWAAVVTYGVEKDIDFLKSGTYSAPGTRRLRLVFDPWWHFPKGPLPEEGKYPIPDAGD